MFVSVSKAQDTGNTKPVIIEPGAGFDGLQVGVTMIEEVIARFGEEYAIITHGSYSQQFVYKRIGVSFYVCNADPQRQIFVIELAPPFRAKTGDGIELGNTTLAKIREKSGEPSDEFNNGLEYSGIHYYYDLNDEELDLTDKQKYERKVVKIDITEKSGLRQCDDFRRDPNHVPDYNEEFEEEPAPENK
ncbi:MAG: hypothetical protein J5I65_06810 [Aridibacter famidurans]|nr:hypothetical protein [Aridibacter famidurans]